jgi:hypothetical protein
MFFFVTNQISIPFTNIFLNHDGMTYRISQSKFTLIYFDIFGCKIHRE